MKLQNELSKTPRKVFTNLYVFDFTSQAEELGERMKLLQDSLKLKVNEVISDKSKK